MLAPHKCFFDAHKTMHLASTSIGKGVLDIETTPDCRGGGLAHRCREAMEPKGGTPESGDEVEFARLASRAQFTQACRPEEEED
ncbi:MAG: hypothetical protein II039_01135 [Treponema sp.]|nr:hypothetical protein [Treponema sp.]